MNRFIFRQHCKADSINVGHHVHTLGLELDSQFSKVCSQGLAKQRRPQRAPPVFRVYNFDPSSPPGNKHVPLLPYPDTKSMLRRVHRFEIWPLLPDRSGCQHAPHHRTNANLTTDFP